MKWNKRRVLVAACILAASGMGVAGAQTRAERERQRMQEAQKRAQEAQHELQQALELLAQAQAEDSYEARERLDDALRELQRARAELGGGRMIADLVSSPDMYFSTSRRGAPQMGVYLNTERKPATDSIGVVLNSVTEDGPAYEAGLRDGDIITSANGQSLARTGRGGMSPANRLIRIKDDLEEGDTLSVEYRRGATTHTADIEVRYLDNISITVDNYDLGRRFAAPEITVLGREGGDGFNVSTMFSGQLSLLGMLDVELVELDSALGWYFGVDEGLLVVRAPNDDQQLDLKSGDVIVSVDGRTPTSQSQLMRILRSYEEGETMELSIMRQREPATIQVTVPKRDANMFWRRNGRF